MPGRSLFRFIAFSFAVILCSGSSASGRIDWRFQVIDTFDATEFSSGENDYGLNEELDVRRLYLPRAGVRWSRRDGTWYNHPPLPWFSQVNHVFSPDVLSFHTEPSAVVNESPVDASVTGRYRIAFRMDPVKGDRSSYDWVSVMLDSSPDTRGYVSETELGFLVRSRGSVALYQNGTAVPVSGSVTAADTYDVTLDLRPGSMVGTINGQRITATLSQALPSRAYVYLGAYIEAQSGHVSWVDDLIVQTPASSGEGHLRRFGYYWAYSSSYGSHIDEVKEHSNFNFVALDGENFATLDSPDFREWCGYKECVPQYRWKLYGGQGERRPDWVEEWNVIREDILQGDNRDRLAALYMMDEPFWAIQVKTAEYAEILDTVGTALPDIPLQTTFAWPTLDTLPWMAGLDRVAFDDYRDDFGHIEEELDRLKGIYPGTPLFLVPPAFGAPDADLAELNWKYYDLALREPDVVGLWNFGLWCFVDPSEVPVTFRALTAMGHAIVGECDLGMSLAGYPSSVARGATLRFSAVGSNGCDDTNSFDKAILEINGPASKRMVLYEGPNIHLGAGEQAQANVSIVVPTRAPTGTYRVALSTYIRGDAIAGDAFEIQVE